jgi:RimJ/RimL family protein N-acetyltransferase
MTAIRTSLASLTLIEPKPINHAPATLSWFESDDGRETLLLMGNAEHEIKKPSLTSETQILEEFVELRHKNEQLTWMLQFKDKVIGVAWIELIENHHVLPPSVHLMIGDKEYRGRGIGKATMQALVQYIKYNIDTKVIYSRHLKSNIVVTNMNRRLGFIDDGESYIDNNMLEWQNVKLLI